MKTMWLYMFGGLFSLCLIAGCSNYTDPPDNFLESKVITPLGMNNFPFGEVSVSQFVESFSKKQLDNGKYPVVKGWTNSDNIYTLHTRIKDSDFEINFVHLLNQQYGSGVYSEMSAVSDGKTIPGIEVMKFIAF